MSLIKKYNCSKCNYASDRKWTIKDHERRVHNTVNIHGTNIAPTTASVGYDTARAPTHQVGSGIQRNEPTLHCESVPAQIYQPNTVSMQDYTKATESAHGWKNAYENLNKQRGSGVFTRADIDKELMHFVTP